MEERITKKYKNSTQYVLSALVPYTESNLKLVFTPKRFFSDLNILDKNKEKTLKNAYYNCIKRGYVLLDELTGQPVITNKGLSKLKPYGSRRLKGSNIMVIFDILETHRHKRRQLRTLLRQLEFEQIQKSVWSTDLDSREYLKAEIKRLNLEKEVKIFEYRLL